MGSETKRKTILAVNEDGQYHVFSVGKDDILEYKKGSDNRRHWMLSVSYKSGNEMKMLPSSPGVKVNESNFATWLGDLKPGEKVELK